jgi:hypothetical protein
MIREKAFFGGASRSPRIVAIAACRKEGQFFIAFARSERALSPRLDALVQRVSMPLSPIRARLNFCPF